MVLQHNLKTLIVQINETLFQSSIIWQVTKKLSTPLDFDEESNEELLS